MNSLKKWIGLNPNFILYFHHPFIHLIFNNSKPLNYHLDTEIFIGILEDL